MILSFKLIVLLLSYDITTIKWVIFSIITLNNIKILLWESKDEYNCHFKAINIFKWW
jgi:hypothetical protein